MSIKIKSNINGEFEITGLPEDHNGHPSIDGGIHYEMAQIGYYHPKHKNPNPEDKDTMVIYIYGEPTRPIPHFHFYRGKDRKFGGCIILNEAKYFPHDHHNDKLNKSEINDLLKYLKSNDPDLNISNWKVIIDYWNRQNPRFTIPIDSPIPPYSHTMLSHKDKYIMESPRRTNANGEIEIYKFGTNEVIRTIPRTKYFQGFENFKNSIIDITTIDGVTITGLKPGEPHHPYERMIERDIPINDVINALKTSAPTSATDGNAYISGKAKVIVKNQKVMTIWEVK